MLNWLKNRCKFFTAHKWVKVKPTETENQIAWRIGVHCMKDLYKCSECGIKRWRFSDK